MYSLPSTSVRCEPRPERKKRGTGLDMALSPLLTPPLRYRLDFSNSSPDTAKRDSVRLLISRSLFLFHRKCIQVLRSIFRHRSNHDGELGHFPVVRFSFPI